MGTKIEGGAYDKLVAQVAKATAEAPVTLSAADLKALSKGFKALAADLMQRYDALRAAGDKAGMRELLQQDSLGATMDHFVIAAEMGRVRLPEGQRAIDVISPAVAEYLQRGMRYSVEIRHQIGGSVFSASELNAQNQPDWHEAIMK
jgi:hypothetical protein